MYVATEAPKEEHDGFYFVSDGNGRPYRMRARAVLYPHWRAGQHCPRQVIADLIANIGSMDVVLENQLGHLMMKRPYA